MNRLRLVLPLVCLFWWLPSCSDDDPASPSGDGGSVDTGPDTEALYACRDQAFSVAKPLLSAEFDPDAGGLLMADPQPSYVVHTTQLFVKPDKYAEFLSTNNAVTEQLEITPGLVAYSLATDTACGDVRTLGIWQSEEAMFAFVGSSAHAQAMVSSLDLSITGRVTHWSATSDEVNALDWASAKDHIASVDQLEQY
jgi:quinol monooxygenase YgiN